MPRTIKRTLSMLLACALVGSAFTAAPIAAGAESTDETTQQGPDITASSLSLSGEIGINFLVDPHGTVYELDTEEADEDTEIFNVYVNMTNESGYSEDPRGGSYDIKWKKDGEYYIFTVYLSAKQMADTVTLTAKTSETSDEEATSVRAYAEQIINATSEQLSTWDSTLTEEKQAQLKDLCKSMLYYGTQAQRQFNYNLNDYANTNISYTPVEVDRTAVNNNAISYIDPNGDWNATELEEYCFVNTYDWEHVYIHYVFTGSDDEGIEIYAEDVCEELQPSGLYYTSSEYSYDSETGGYNIVTADEPIYYFDLAHGFERIVFTPTNESLIGKHSDIYGSSYVKYYEFLNTDFAGVRRFILGSEDGEYGSYDYLYNYDPSFPNVIEYVDSQDWENVYITYSDGSELDHTVQMTETPRTTRDGKKVYSFELPSDFTNGTLTFKNGTSDSAQTTIPVQYNSGSATVWESKTRVDVFREVGLSYEGTSLGLIDWVGYSILFKKVGDNEIKGFYDETGRSVQGNLRDSNNIYTSITIPDIAPQDIFKTFTVTIRYEDENYELQSKNYDFTVQNYIELAFRLDDSNDNRQLKATVTALYDYGLKAKAYAG